jgi:hypothetical protein
MRQQINPKEFRLKDVQSTYVRCLDVHESFQYQSDVNQICPCTLFAQEMTWLASKRGC